MRCWIAFLLCISVEIATGYQKEVIVTMQTKKWTHLLSDHFLSLTVTPEIALQLEDFSKSTMNMLKGLSPTTLRLGGPSTDKMKFMPERINSDNFTITEAQWRRLNQFIEDVNMTLIVCLNSKERVHGVWESHDAVELIYSSEKNGYKLGWELGYESQQLQQDGVTGSQLGRDVARLKNILGDFSLYTDSPIIGPDMISLSTPEEVRFLREYLEESADFLTAITWHPRFSSDNPENEDVNHKFLRIIHDMENKIWNRNNGLRLPIQPPPKKPIWLAESDSDDYTGKFADSLTWMRRLGAAARLGFPVIMKKLTATSLINPTPDYWVSLLYKALVGRAVMDVKYLAGNNRTSLQVFSHCALASSNEENSVLRPGLRYSQGAVVLYGLNLDEHETRLTVRGNVKEETVHKYVLTKEQLKEEEEAVSEEEEEEEIRKRPSPQKTLLNGQLLSLLPNGELPTISPVEMRPTRTLSFNIPGRSVFFFVLPDMKLKTCMSFTNIQGSVEKINNLEKGLNLKSGNLGVTRPEEVPKFNFAPVGNNNLESKLPTDVRPEKTLPNFGVGLRGRFSDGRINRGFMGLPKPRLTLESDKPKILETVNEMQDETSISNIEAMEEPKKDDEFKEETNENEMQPINDDYDNDNGKAISHTRFVMFSDDDWLSDFTRAQESVELARKAIAAFDEAKQQESQKSPQNSYEEQIMNQKMSPARRRIYEALTKRNNSNKIGSDKISKNSEMYLNESDKDEKVNNRERRDNMIHEMYSQNKEETPVMSNTFSGSEFDKETQNKTGHTNSNIMTIVRSNDIPKFSLAQKNITLEKENLNNSQTSNQNFNSETSVGNSVIGNQNNISTNVQIDDNIAISSILETRVNPKNIEIGEMVLKPNSNEENNCFGHIESDLKVVTENSTLDEDLDEMLKLEAERELNNYFEGISRGEVSSLEGIGASDESGESVEDYDERELQQHSIVLQGVNDKSCKITNKAVNGTQNVIDKVSSGLTSSEREKEELNVKLSSGLPSSGKESEELKIELSSEIPSSERGEKLNSGSMSSERGEVKMNQSAGENGNLQTTDLPDEVVFSENDKRADRGRREMFGSPFNYYDSRYNTQLTNQLTLREIKELIDELAARKRELNYVMLNQRKTPETKPKLNNYQENTENEFSTDHTNSDSSTGPMHIKIEDTVQEPESPINDYKVESTDYDDFSNVQYSIIDDENKQEQTNRLYRQPQTDKISVEGIEDPIDKDFEIGETQVNSDVGAPLTSQSKIESSSDQVLNIENKFSEGTKPENVVESDIPLSVAREEVSQNEKSENKLLEKTESMDGDVHLTEVKNAPEIPTTYSKVVSVAQYEDIKSKVDKGEELGRARASKAQAPATKTNAAQLRLERIEAIRNRILENRKKVLNKSNQSGLINKTPEVLKKVPVAKSDTNNVAATSDAAATSNVAATNNVAATDNVAATNNVDEKASTGYLQAEAQPTETLKETPIVESKADNVATKVDEKISSGYLEEGAPTCKASRAAPYVEGIENWIDKIERNSEETVIDNTENQEVIETKNNSSTFDKIDGDRNTSEDKPKKFDLIKSNRLITGTNRFTNKLNGLKISSSIITKNQEIDGLPFEDIDSPFIIIPTSYAIIPIKPKGSRSAKNVRGYRSYPMNDEDSSVIGQEESNQNMRTYTDLEVNDRAGLGDGDIIPRSFPLMVEDPEFTESYIENYGREKRSPEDAEENNEKMLNRGLLNVEGLRRRFKGFRENFKLGDKLQSVAPKLSLEEMRSKAQARFTELRESLKNARLKTPIKSRETRAISNIEGRTKIKSVLTLPEEIEANEIPKRRGEYINVYEPKIDDRLQLSSAEFEKKMNGCKTYSRSTPLSSRKSMIHLDDIGREKLVSPKEYTDNDYIVERMSMTDRAVVGLKHSVEELENTAKEILDKFRTSDYSNVEERKKPSLSNILQNTLRIGRPKEPKRTGALAFLNPIIDLALKFMRTLGIIS